MPSNSRAMTVTFIGDTKSLEDALKRANQRIASLETQSGKTAKGTAKSNAEMTASFEKMTKRIVTGAAAISGGYLALSKIKSTIQGAIETTAGLAHTANILHSNFGLATKTAGEWGVVMKARGTDATRLTMSFKQFATQIHNARDALSGHSQALDQQRVKDQATLDLAAKQGASLKQLTDMRQKMALAESEATAKSQQQLKAFKELGISAQDLAKHGDDMNFMLHAVADGMGKLPAGTDKAALAARLFGRSWQVIAPLIRDGSKSMDEQLNAAGKLAPITDKVAQQQEQLRIANIGLKESSMGLKIAFATALTPELLRLSTVATHVAADLHGPGSFDDKMHKLGQDIAPAVKSIRDEFNKELPKIADFAGQEAPKVAISFVKGFTHADIWGQLALGGFLITKLGAWGSIFSKIGKSDALSWGKSYSETAAAEAAAATAAGGEINAAANAPSMWSKIGSAAGKTFGLAFAGAAAYDISANLEKMFHGSHGPNAGGRQSITSGGQQDFASWVQNVFGISPPGSITPQINQGIPNALKNLSQSQSNYREVARRSAIAAGIDPDLFIKQIFQESGFNPNARSGAGALGIAQLMPGTAKSLHVNPLNADASLEAAASLMAKYLAKYGNWRDALTAYNAGPGAVGKPLPNETKQYQQAILGGLKTPKADPTKAAVVPADLAWAQRMVGHFRETMGTNRGPELDRLQKEFGTTAAAWCAEFATKALVQGGFPNAVKTASVSSLNAFAKAGKFGLKFTGAPKAGDLMTFGDRHVAIVESIDKSKGIVHTIAGNTGKGEVSRSTYALGAGKYISVNAAGAHLPGTATQKTTAYDRLQKVLTTLQLEVDAGILKARQAAEMERAAIAAALPHLRGDNRLQALVTLRGLPTAAQETWTGANKRQLALAYLRLNPRTTNPAVLKAAGINTTMDNPWMKAFMGNIDNQVGSGAISDDQGNRARLGALQGALPYLTGQTLADAKTQIKLLTDAIVANTNATKQDTAQLASGGGGIASSLISILNMPGGKAALDAIVGQGVDQIPGAPGLSISGLENSSNPNSYLSSYYQGTVLPADISALSSSGQTPDQLQADFGKLVDDVSTMLGLTAQIAASTQAELDITKQERDDALRGEAITGAQAAAMGRWLRNELSRGMGYDVSGRGLTPSYGVGRRS